jgi:hypothetical protein
MEESHLFDPWTRDYALLGLRMERLAPGTVDAWIGPAAWKAAVDAEPAPTPASLRQEAQLLAEMLPSMEYTPDREGYLLRQVRALDTQARVLAGEPIPLVEQAQLYFDITPERTPEDTLAAAHAEMDRLLPGSGALAERWAAWRKGFQTTPERAMPLIDRIAAEVRRRTAAHLPLPEGESIELALVRDQPWGAYNWYKGNNHSLIEINTDLPMQADGLVDYLAHEGYPGHHTEHSLREALQLRGQRQGEYAIQLINTPESLIAEAIATSARRMIFDGGEDLAWAAREIFPALGITADPDLAGQIREAASALRLVGGNVAFLLHADNRPAEEAQAYLERWALRTPTEAAHSLQFQQSPLWRVYTFTYIYGQRLFAPLLAGPDRWQVFRRLLTTPVYPSMLAGA